MVAEAFERQPRIEHQRMRSFICFLLTICVAFVCVANGNVKDKEVHSWLRDFDHALVDRKRFPAASRLKSGPTPGSWYYIMGHRKDSKRSASIFSSPYSSSSVSSYYGFPSHALPVEDQRDNVIPQMLLPDLLTGTGVGGSMGEFSQRTRPRTPFGYQAPQPKAPRPDAGSLDGPILPVGAFPLEEEEEAVGGSVGSVGGDRETEETSGRMLIKDFFQFLRMKDEKTQDGCITSTSQSKTD